MFGRTVHADGSILYFLTNGRIARLLVGLKDFFDSHATNIIFEMGLAGVSKGVLSGEMDIFDLMFSAELLGVIVVCAIYCSFLKNYRKSFWSVIILIFAFVLLFEGSYVSYGCMG